MHIVGLTSCPDSGKEIDVKKQATLILFCAANLNLQLLAQLPSGWKSHDMARPRPPVVHPAEPGPPVSPPSDALVLFDGKDLSKWRSASGGPAGWKVRDGYMEVSKSAGSIWTKEIFGDVQLHLEWSAPQSDEGGQGAGNSGLYLMGQYELQILSSHETETYADGQAGALYGQFPPLVNASRSPGAWQSYDIVFRRPRFDPNGELLQPARVTLFHNGVLAQDSTELVGPTAWLQPKPYTAHPDQLPMMLQNHGAPNRFRNIWVRRLREYAEPGPLGPVRPIIPMSAEQLAAYAGTYEYERGGELSIVLEDGILLARMYAEKHLELVPRSQREFELRWTAAQFVFDLDSKGHPTALTFHIGGETRRARRLP